MRLLLLRHGRAVDRLDWTEDDRLRPLTRRGTAILRRACKAMRPLLPGLNLSEVLTSPWTRARETAELAAELWKLPLREVPWLAGGAASPAERALQLDPLANVALVGHEPDLGAFAGYLLGAPALAMKKSGLAVLRGTPGDGGMELELWLPPKAVLTLADRG